MSEPKQPEKSSRRRIIVRSVIVAFVVIFGWIGVLIGLQYAADDPYNFNAEIEHTLSMMRDGKARELYWTTSPRLRKARSEDRFIQQATDLNRFLGEFKEVLGTSDAVVHDKAQGKTGYVRATLRFQRGKVAASFSWHFDPQCVPKNDAKAKHKKGCWRLFGFYIEVPKSIAAEYKKHHEVSEEAMARAEAPAEVIALVTRTLEKVRDGKLREVYDAAHPSFRSTVSFVQFEERQRVRRRELGAFVQVLKLASSGHDDDSKKSWLTLALGYSKTQTLGTFEFWKTDGSWRLSRFIVQIPLVQVPRRPTAP